MREAFALAFAVVILVVLPILSTTVWYPASVYQRNLRNHP